MSQWSDDRDISLRVNFFPITYQVMGQSSNGPGGYLAFYNVCRWGPWDTQNARGMLLTSHGSVSLKAVIDDILAHYQEDFPPGYADPGEPQDLRGSDLVIWYRYRLVAFVFKDAAGNPVARILEEGGHQGG